MMNLRRWVIEGTDRAGKDTFIKAFGDWKVVKFPEYESVSGGICEKFLKGRYNDTFEPHDRDLLEGLAFTINNKEQERKLINVGENVICNRSPYSMPMYHSSAKTFIFWDLMRLAPMTGLYDLIFVVDPPIEKLAERCAIPTDHENDKFEKASARHAKYRNLSTTILDFNYMCPPVVYVDTSVLDETEMNFLVVKLKDALTYKIIKETFAHCFSFRLDVEYFKQKLALKFEIIKQEYFNVEAENDMGIYIDYRVKAVLEAVYAEEQDGYDYWELERFVIPENFRDAWKTGVVIF